MGKLKRNSLFLGIISVIVLFFSVSFIWNFDNSGVTEEEFQLIREPEQNVQTNDGELTNSKLVVDVKGAVVVPGVYEMKQGDRVVDVIKKASGFLDEANQDVINLALILEDEMVIFVPRIGEENVEQMEETISQNKANGKINLNTATAEELQEIPGIGPAKATAIISYRDEVNKFQKLDDLTNVSGIGQKTIEKLADFIEVK